MYVAFENDEPENPLICKHCKTKYASWRGFKLHVKVTHLKRLGFLCPYCDRSTNSETLMRQHIRSKHPGCVEKIVQNPDAGGPEPSNEFWEKEYGLICPKKSKKNKRKINPDADNNSSGNKSNGDSDTNNRTDVQEKCETCGFIAMNYTGLKSHMKTHMRTYLPKHSIKCQYCTFSCSIKAELQEHWEINHPSIPFKIQDVAAADPLFKKRSSIDMYKDDVEEECVPIDDSASVAATSITIYSCYYCNLRSHSLVTMKRHWNYMHKDSEKNSDATAALPFKYRQQHLPLWTKLSTKDHQTKKDSESSSSFSKHSEESSSRSGVSSNAMTVVPHRGWICQWCEEFCETENDTKTHHNLFHSHLASKFKMQKQEQQPENDQLKEYVCTVCSYASISVFSIRKHVIKHIDLFKCKYCDQTFNTSPQVATHSAEKHPGLVAKIESISNFHSIVESLIKVKWNDAVASGSVTLNKHDQNLAPRAVAKKSTTKSIISHIRPGPRAFKAVARKSTNPLPRYLRAGTNCSVVDQQQYAAETKSDKVESKSPSSYYGIPRAPIDLSKLHTSFEFGGCTMRVNCATLAQLKINIDPQVKLKDIKYDSKFSAILPKYD